MRATPPLITASLRCGANVDGPPSFDQGFNTVDLPIIMQLPDMPDLPERYSKRFLARRSHS